MESFLLEDFPVLPSLNFDNLVYQDILKHLKEEYPLEGCGLVIVFKGKYKYIPCKNTANKKTQDFVISSTEYAKAEDLGEVVCVVHSHTCYPPRPSETDLACQKQQGIPWLIVSLDENYYEQIAWINNLKEETPLYGRKYVWHVYDCYSFIKDWYQQEFNITIPDFIREEKFWEKKQQLYLDNFEKAGFVEVPFKDLQYGDVILLQLAGDITSHGAIYVDKNQIAHHLPNRLSSKDVYGQYYRDRTTKIVRHKDKICSEQ